VSSIRENIREGSLFKLSRGRCWLAIVPALVLALSGCSSETPIAEITTPTLPSCPDTLDPVSVQEAVENRINEIRAGYGFDPLLRDAALQDLAEERAWGIVKGDVPFDEVDGAVANQLGEPVAELRACLSDNATTPEAVAQAAGEEWLAGLDEVLLGEWRRIGAGFDWGCPKEGGRGVVLVVLLAGGKAQDLARGGFEAGRRHRFTRRAACRVA
jgi:hypothetical protein